MARTELDLGPTGRAVSENVKRLRQARGLTYADLSRELESVGRRIPTLGLRKIEAQERRVDVDELVALARVLWVDVPTLLMPQTLAHADTVQLTGADRYPSGGEIAAASAWAWLRAERMGWGGPDGDESMRFQELNWPRWDRRSAGGEG